MNSSKCCNTADIIDYDMDACIAQRWGWTSTCSVLSAIVASQAATEKPVWAPRPSADNGAAGATVTPRSPLPGTARSREVLGLVGTPYALGQVHVLKRAAWCRLGLFCFNALDALASTRWTRWTLV